VGEMKKLMEYGTHTIDDLIKVLKVFRDNLGGDTLVHLADFECNCRHKQFEINQVVNEKELFLFFERNEDWEDSWIDFREERENG
jgi:hypothetical protein